MTLNDIFYSPDVLRAMATLFAVGGSSIVLYVITLWGAAKGADYWRAIKGSLPAVLEQFDEPTDSANVMIDRWMDHLWKAQWDQMAAVFMPKLIDDLGKMVDAKLAAPPREVALEAMPKLEIPTIMVFCDRCKRAIQGMEFSGGTAGFYHVDGPPWSKYANPGEAVLCDDCMQSDPRYQADYPQGQAPEATPSGEA